MQSEQNLFSTPILHNPTTVFPVILILLFASMPVFSQPLGPDFQLQSQTITQTGMMVLGSWALANMAWGAYGWKAYDHEKKYFSQMNFFWNTVNLSIAGISLYQQWTTGDSFSEANPYIQKHLDTEKLLLINAGLDLLYIGTGFFLKQKSGSSTKNQYLLKGYGQSLILQGGFLFLFDLILYEKLRNLRTDWPVQMSLLQTGELPMLSLSLSF